MVPDKVRHSRPIVKDNSEALRFVMVGGLGFAINTLLLWLLHGQAGINLLISQIVAAETAIWSNFLFHSAWTYRSYQDISLLKRVAMFHTTAWTGSLITIVCLVVLVGVFHVHYLLSLALGGGLAMAWNFVLNRTLIWRRPDNAQLTPGKSD